MMVLAEQERMICVKGDYTPTDLMGFHAQLDQCLAGLSKPKDLDLTHLQGSDSGLITLLLSFQRHANENQWQVKLINASDGIKGLIELSQLNEFFTLVEEDKPSLSSSL
ncbi:hypothetical protein MED121_21887 [Marinomonas sp. MED121]|uniref:STAS domain-containing protein n=1 Tax=Marinomonas sp. MED121 TaxID=314277 RepID=UPI000068FDF4|nr:STAS domain-containing protein [Marinomonas sp. MED121]EAQ65367.1 hypothetical protein MED121_21887 [Marinomonas sp. MED121]